MNPYYDSDQLGWDLHLLEPSGLSYEFDMLVFWRTPDGLVYTAQDSG